MPLSQDITINGRIYRVNPEEDRYQIPFTELDDIRIRDIPPHSSVEIMGLKKPEEVIYSEVTITNGVSERELELPSAHGSIKFNITESEHSSVLRRLHAAFPKLDDDGLIKNPYITIDTQEDGLLYAFAYYSRRIQLTNATFRSLVNC
jgi:hypothetical protein